MQSEESVTITVKKKVYKNNNCFSVTGLKKQPDELIIKRWIWIIQTILPYVCY